MEYLWNKIEAITINVAKSGPLNKEEFQRAGVFSKFLGQWGKKRNNKNYIIRSKDI